VTDLLCGHEHHAFINGIRRLHKNIRFRRRGGGPYDSATGVFLASLPRSVILLAQSHSVKTPAKLAGIVDDCHALTCVSFIQGQASNTVDLERTEIGVFCRLAASNSVTVIMVDSPSWRIQVMAR